MAASTRSTSALSLKGFSTKSKAPAFSARTATGTSAWPVRKITGAAQPAARSRSNVSGPEMPPIRTSSMMQAQSGSGSASRKASPEGQPCTRSPREAKRNERVADRLVIVDDMDAPCHSAATPSSAAAGNATRNTVPPPSRGRWVRRPRCISTMVRQMFSPMPIPSALVEGEGVEQPVGHLGRDAGAPVGHLDHGARGPGAEAHGQRIDGSRLAHRLDAVAHEVDEELLEQDPVGEHKRRGRHVDRDPHPAHPRIRLEETGGLAHDRRQIERREPRLALAHEILDPADDLARPVGLMRELGQRRRQKRRIRPLLPQEVRGPRRIARDGGERLVQLMRQRRGHLAQRHQTARPRKALLLLAGEGGRRGGPR